MEQRANTADDAKGDSSDGSIQSQETSSPTDEQKLDATEPMAQLEVAKREAAENYDRYLRAHAEMENFKKRIERTYAQLSRNSKKDLLLKLLSVKDNLERALAYSSKSNPDQDESVIQGVRLTEYQLDQLLRAEGVKPMELKGKTFDPQVAEAVGTRVDPEAPDHSVAEVAQAGYMYQDEVLRPAKVIVAVAQTGEEV
jgi:molecular chaperone GrpE